MAGSAFAGRDYGKGQDCRQHPVLAASQIDGGANRQSPFAPMPIADVVARIHADRPGFVCAHMLKHRPHDVAGDYIRAVADVHAVGGIFVLDCVASGAMWVDMQALDVDVLLSAPQKGWSASPCSGLVMLSDAHVRALIRPMPPAMSAT